MCVGLHFSELSYVVLPTAILYFRSVVLVSFDTGNALENKKKGFLFVTHCSSLSLISRVIDCDKLF